MLFFRYEFSKTIIIEFEDLWTLIENIASDILTSFSESILYSNARLSPFDVRPGPSPGNRKQKKKITLTYGLGFLSRRFDDG